MDACLESVVSGAEFLSDLHLLHSSVVFVAIATSCFASVQISMHSQGFQGQSGANSFSSRVASLSMQNVTCKDFGLGIGPSFVSL